MPTTVEATCTPGAGIEVSTDTVVAAADGVRVTVVNNSGHNLADIGWGWSGRIVSGERATDHPPLQLRAPPGDLLLSCSPSPNTEGAEVATVRVVDPDSHWTKPERPEDAGCTPDGVFYSLPPATGATELAALDALVASGYPDETLTYEVHYLLGGYRKDTDRGGQFVLRRNTKTVAFGVVGEQNGEWSAHIDGSCAERLGEPYDPLEGFEGEHDVLRVTCTSDGASAEPSTSAHHRKASESRSWTTPAGKACASRTKSRTALKRWMRLPTTSAGSTG